MFVQTNVLRWIAVLCVCMAVARASAVVVFNNKYYSPRNRERDIRKSTTHIILHTTEAPSRSALPKLSDRGECHYCIDEAGKVYRIIDRKREAFHAGRSMWQGKSNADTYTIGIEVCGYHDKPLKAVQLTALQELIQELKGIYKLSDDRVISHAHVAYGVPNRWQKRSHRGRKRCGMQFAMKSVRKKLKLKKRPTVDPDVRAKRLVNADTYLASVLYGNVDTMATARKKKSRVASSKATSAPKTKEPAKITDEGIEDVSRTISKTRSAWDIAREAYRLPSTIYIFPDGTRKKGSEILNFKSLPAGVKVVVDALADEALEGFQTIGVQGTLKDIAGDEAFTKGVFIVRPNGTYARGDTLTESDAKNLPYGTKVFVGYALGGPIAVGRKASDFCGNRWRSPETFFLISKTLVSGDKVNDRKLHVGTVFFYKQ